MVLCMYVLFFLGGGGGEWTSSCKKMLMSTDGPTGKDKLKVPCVLCARGHMNFYI